MVGNGDIVLELALVVLQAGGTGSTTMNGDTLLNYLEVQSGNVIAGTLEGLLEISGTNELITDSSMGCW